MLVFMATKSHEATLLFLLLLSLIEINAWLYSQIINFINIFLFLYIYMVNSKQCWLKSVTFNLLPHVAAVLVCCTKW